MTPRNALAVSIMELTLSIAPSTPSPKSQLPRVNQRMLCNRDSHPHRTPCRFQMGEARCHVVEPGVKQPDAEDAGPRAGWTHGSRVVFAGPATLVPSDIREHNGLHSATQHIDSTRACLFSCELASRAVVQGCVCNRKDSKEETARAIASRPKLWLAEQT